MNYNSPFIIAEIAQAHDGSLGILHSYIDALSKCGVDAIKFQTHIAEAESSEYEKFRINFSYEDKTRYDYWQRMEFTKTQWLEIKSHCEDVGLEFMSSPFSNAAVDLLEKLHVKRYKVGSGEVNNLLILEKIAKTGKPLIISSGMSSFQELDETINFLKPFKNPLSVLQCTTAYPNVSKDWGLNMIEELKNKYNFPIGFSDHSGDIHACLAATALGAEILEFHVVFDKRQFGPDSSSSISIDQTKELVKGVREISISLNNPVNKSDNTRFLDLKNMFEKSLAVNKRLMKGEVISFDDLEAKKPANIGVPASDYKNIIGKVLNNNKDKWDFIKKEDFK